MLHLADLGIDVDVRGSLRLAVCPVQHFGPALVVRSEITAVVYYRVCGLISARECVGRGECPVPVGDHVQGPVAVLDQA